MFRNVTSCLLASASAAARTATLTNQATRSATSAAATQQVFQSKKEIFESLKESVPHGVAGNMPREGTAEFHQWMRDLEADENYCPNNEKE